jgi:hypothetical protein
MQPDAQAALVEQIEAENRLSKQNPQRLREVQAGRRIRSVANAKETTRHRP